MPDNVKHHFSESTWSRGQEVLETLQKKWLCCILDLWLVTEGSILSLLLALSVSSSCRKGSLTQLQLLLNLHSTQELPAALQSLHMVVSTPAQHQWRMNKNGSHIVVSTWPRFPSAFHTGFMPAFSRWIDFDQADLRCFYCELFLSFLRIIVANPLFLPSPWELKTCGCNLITLI